MADGMNPESPSSSSERENGENDLQPFFVLHKFPPRKSANESQGGKKTRKKVESPLASSTSKGRLGSRTKESLEEVDYESHYENLRMEAFESVWSKFDSGIKDVLKQINLDLLGEVLAWVKKSFGTINIPTKDMLLQATIPLFLREEICRQVFTGFVFTKNAESVDDLLTFDELAVYLKSNCCHVATLSSSDFSAKNGIGCCIRSLLRQLAMIAPDAADFSILALWYAEPANYGLPVVVIIKDMEQCNPLVLSQLITITSEWAGHIPVIFVMGVATMDDTPSRMLSSNALQLMRPFKFTMRSPVDKVEAIIMFLFVDQFYGFQLGHEVAAFLEVYFYVHDGTVTSFLRALKIACSKHFYAEQLSFLCKYAAVEDGEASWSEVCKSLPDSLLIHLANLPSCHRSGFANGDLRENISNSLSENLVELKSLQRSWSSVVKCLSEAGKLAKLRFFDIFCEALDPSMLKLVDSFNHTETRGCHDFSSALNCIDAGYKHPDTAKGLSIARAIQKVRDLPRQSLISMLEAWLKHTEGLDKQNIEVQELLKKVEGYDNSETSMHDHEDLQGRPGSRKLVRVKEPSSLNEEAALLVERMVRDYLVPMERSPFHEVFCFRDTGMLQSALAGDPRRTIQEDILNSQLRLNCTCCDKKLGNLSNSMQDTTIMYILAQEHGDLINIHDWYQSFKETVVNSKNSSSKCRRKVQKRPTSKDRKTSMEPDVPTEASIQYPFSLYDSLIHGFFKADFQLEYSFSLMNQLGPSP